MRSSMPSISKGMAITAFYPNGLPLAHKNVPFHELRLIHLGISMVDMEIAHVIRVINTKTNQKLVLKDRY